MPHAWNEQWQTTQHVSGSQAQTREESKWDISAGRRRVQDPSTGVEKERKDTYREEEAHEKGRPEALCHPNQ